MSGGAPASGSALALAVLEHGPSMRILLSVIGGPGEDGMTASISLRARLPARAGTSAVASRGGWARVSGGAAVVARARSYFNLACCRRSKS